MELGRRQFMQAIVAVNAAALMAGLPILASAELNTPFWHYRLETPWDMTKGYIISWSVEDLGHPPNVVFSPDGTELFLY